MNIITHKAVLLSIKKNNFSKIKAIIGRERLRFTYTDISFYCYQIILHTIKNKRYYALYNELKNSKSNFLLKVKYSTYMNNIALFSPLIKFIFDDVNNSNNIKASSLLNKIDSTLIPEKQEKYITNKDWSSGRVTTRTTKAKNSTNKVKYHICGSKGLFLTNRINQIYHVERLKINDSDQNVLKDPYRLMGKLKGILLADRGFSNKLVRLRLSANKNDIFNMNYNKPICRLISPYHYKEKLTLTKKEKKLYKYRWSIETLFMNIKDSYSSNKLNLTGKYTKKLKEAKLFASCILYNLSTLKA